MILYKHPEMRDVAFEILKKYYIKEKDAYGVKLLYYTRFPESQEYWCNIVVERLKLPAKKVRE